LEHASSATAIAVRDVSLPYLLYVSYPSPRVGKTNPETIPRANALILRRCSRTPSSKLHHLLAFLLCGNFWCSAIVENRLQTATKFLFEKAKYCFLT
jgi:hypothetical protein